jgi:putative aldouronate transport system permease protein
MVARQKAQLVTASSNGNVPSDTTAGNDMTFDAMPHAGTIGDRLVQQVRRWWPYYLMMAPGIVFFVLFHYLPIWESKIAFEQVRIIPPNIWVGLKHFQVLFASPVFWQVMVNTLIISGMKMAFVFPVPILVALMLNEVRSGSLRKFIQSAVYLPHFLSWVVIAGVFIAALSPSDGVVNDITGVFGAQPRSFMTDNGAIRWVLVFSEMWRSAGWDSLLYLAAIIAIDQQLYDAAEIDGANRWQKIWYVTIPGIVPTIATLFILNAGIFLSADLNQVINFSNDVVRSQIDIVDTYVYRIGLQTGEYSLATAAGLFKAILGMLLILMAHLFSKRLTGKGVW